MGILSDLRSGFYKQITQEHVLVFVTPDVDGVCAWRILRHIFRQGQVLYTLIVVTGKTSLCSQFKINKNRTDKSDEESDEDEQGGKQSTTIRAAEKRINRRRWERKRQEILIEYESFSYHSTASAVVLFDLAWKLSQDNQQLLW
ncbi:unnamed protein product [Dibothriocephalus latus]|uniref:Uncharacterized protein n=1 Tax=Dibothriocephalus latus TaxID=60516 RepID=A0A3P7P7B5_DIBLA|nr:unnamed protein product [Dibothriocephalus latus]